MVTDASPWIVREGPEDRRGKGRVARVERVTVRHRLRPEQVDRSPVNLPGELTATECCAVIPAATIGESAHSDGLKSRIS